MSNRAQVVVFASGTVLSVATREVEEGAPPCIVVDYAERLWRERGVAPEDFERELLGVDRWTFDQSATYIW